MPEWKIICEYLRVNRNVGLANDVADFAKRQEAIDAATRKLVEAVEAYDKVSDQPLSDNIYDALAGLKEASK